MTGVDLDPLRVEHADEMFRGLQNTACYSFIPESPPVSVTWLRQRYGRLARGASPDGTETWCNWVIRDGGDRSALGYTQATVKADAALIAYLVFPEHWRRGVATAAVGQMLQLLFRDHGVSRVSALVDTRNAPSCGLLRRLGFSVLREIRDADHFHGQTSHEFEFELRISGAAKSIG